MSFIIRSNFGGANALPRSDEENSPSREAALRLSLGIRVNPPYPHGGGAVLSSQPRTSSRSADLRPERYEDNDRLAASVSNFEASASEVTDLASATESVEFSSGSIDQPARLFHLNVTRETSDYDLTSLASYAALKIG